MKKDSSTEEKILQAGRQLFSKSGYVGTSMADIAKETGITKAALYYFFKNKQALYIRILSELIDRASAIYDVDPTSDPQKALKKTILDVVAVSMEYGSMLETIDPSQLDTKADDFKVIVEKQIDYDKKVQSFLKQCGIKDTKLASHTLGASTHGYIQRVLFGIKDISAEKYASYMSELLLR